MDNLVKATKQIHVSVETIAIVKLVKLAIT